MVDSLLHKYVKGYLPFFKTYKIDTSIVEGRIRLQNIQLDECTLNTWGLPFTVESGSIDSVDGKISASWLHRPSNEPVTIHMRNLNAKIVLFNTSSDAIKQKTKWPYKGTTKSWKILLLLLAITALVLLLVVICGKLCQQCTPREQVKMEICPQYWTRRDGLCSRFSDITMKWDEAESVCRSWGSHLASVHDNLLDGAASAKGRRFTQLDRRIDSGLHEPWGKEHEDSCFQLFNLCCDQE